MDPQKLSQLDPKLREAYQRVMGTPIPQPRGEPASPKIQRGEPIQAQTPPPPATSDVVPAGGHMPPMPDPTTTPLPQPESVSEPQSAIPQPDPVPPLEPAISPEPPVQASNFVQMNSEVAAAPSQNFAQPTPIAQAQTMAIKKKSGIMMPVLFGIVGLASIAIYTLFWTKIFNFKLPFLP